MQEYMNTYLLETVIMKWKPEQYLTKKRDTIAYQK